MLSLSFGLWMLQTLLTGKWASSLSAQREVHVYMKVTSSMRSSLSLSDEDKSNSRSFSSALFLVPARNCMRLNSAVSAYELACAIIRIRSLAKMQKGKNAKFPMIRYL